MREPSAPQDFRPSQCPPDPFLASVRYRTASACVRRRTERGAPDAVLWTLAPLFTGRPHGIPPSHPSPRESSYGKSRRPNYCASRLPPRKHRRTHRARTLEDGPAHQPGADLGRDEEWRAPLSLPTHRPTATRDHEQRRDRGIRDRSWRRAAQHGLLGEPGGSRLRRCLPGHHSAGRGKADSHHGRRVSDLQRLPR